MTEQEYYCQQWWEKKGEKLVADLLHPLQQQIDSLRDELKAQRGGVNFLNVPPFPEPQVEEDQEFHGGD